MSFIHDLCERTITMATKTQPSSFLLLLTSLFLLLVSTIVPSSALSATLRSDIQVLESLSYAALTQVPSPLPLT